MFKPHLLYSLATSGSECAAPPWQLQVGVYGLRFMSSDLLSHALNSGRAHCARQCKHSCTASHLHMNSCLAAHIRWTHRMQGGLLSLSLCDRWCRRALKGQFFPKLKDFDFVALLFCLSRLLLVLPSWNVYGLNVNKSEHFTSNFYSFELPLLWWLSQKNKVSAVQMSSVPQHCSLHWLFLSNPPSF